jgi:hypothetical protein
MVANKKRMCYFAPMPVRSCRVTIQDMDGVSHTVKVTTATLYGMKPWPWVSRLFRCDEWVAGIAQEFNVVKVSVADVRVEHEVMISQSGWREQAALRARLAIVTEFGRSSACRFPDRIRSLLHQIGAWTTPAELQKSILNSNAGDADVSRERGLHPHSARGGVADGIDTGSQSGRGTGP